MAHRRGYQVVGVLGVLIGFNWQLGIALGDQQLSQDPEIPKFVPLAIGQEALSGRVKDERTLTELEQISLFGSTEVGGVLSEKNDAVTTINLAQVRRLAVHGQAFVSLRYPDKQLCLVDRELHDGSQTRDLLFPEKIVLCGIQKHTNDRKAWFLSKIDYLELDGPCLRSEKLCQALPAQVHEPVVPAPKHHAPISVPTPVHQAVPAPVPQPVAATTEVFQEKRVVVMEKHNGALEKKSVFQALNDVFMSLLGLVKALFEKVRSLFMW